MSLFARVRSRARLWGLARAMSTDFVLEDVIQNKDLLRTQAFIGGEWHGGADIMDVLDPATNQVETAVDMEDDRPYEIICCRFCCCALSRQSHKWHRLVPMKLKMLSWPRLTRGPTGENSWQKVACVNAPCYTASYSTYTHILYCVHCKCHYYLHSRDTQSAQPF